MHTKFYPYLVISLLLILNYSCKKEDTKGPDPVLNLSRTDIEVGNDVGYTDTLVVQSNTDWTINVSAGADAWLSVDPATKTAGDSTIVTVKVIAANTLAAQTGTITFTPAVADVQPRQINITRKTYSMVWQKCYGGSADDQGLGTVLLPNGQFVTAGYSYSTDGDASGNPVYPLAWVLKADNDGNKLWQKKVDPTSLDFRAIAASPDGGTVCLGTGGVTNKLTDIYAVKLDASGNTVWKKNYGGSLDDVPYKVISTADGGYLVAGDTYSSDGDVKTNHGGKDLWVVKLDANGDIAWEKTFGGTGNEEAATVAACSDGGYVIFGYTASNNSGDVGINHGGWDLLVVKIDANGNKLWSKTMGGSSTELSYAAMGDTDGGCILLGITSSIDGDVTGRSDNDMDIWVVKLTKDGNPGWQTSLGGWAYDVGYNIARLPNGNIVLACSSQTFDRVKSANLRSTDIWMVVLNRSGKVLWKKPFGSSGTDGNMDLNVAADGSILVSNYVTGNDEDVSGNHGKRDGWIFKLK